MRKTIRPANLAFYVSSLLVPSIFTILVFFITHVAPFGHNTVASVDFSNQYMALFAYLKRALAGNASWAYSSEFGLGGNVFGVITYYLLSPLNVILLFFHVTELPYFGTLITVVKISLIGFTTFLFLQKSKFVNEELLCGSQLRFKNYTSLMFSSFFPLCSFVFAYKECIMWLDALVLLPLVLLGMDRIIYGRRPLLFIVSASGAIITNFYFGYIVLLFSGIVFVFWIIRALLCKMKSIAITVICFAFSSVLVLLISAVVTLPGFLGSSQVRKSAIFHFWPVYSFPNLISQLFSESQVFNTNLHVPIIYVGLLVLVVFFIFFMQSGVRFIDRALAGAMLIFVVFTTWIDFFYLIWHAMAWPNGYPQRESFVIPFIFCVLGYVALLRAFDDSSSKFAKQLFASFTLILTLAFIGTVHMSLEYMLVVLIVTLAICVFLYLFVAYRRLRYFAISFVLALVSLFYVDFKVERLSANESMKVGAYKKFILQSWDEISFVTRNDKSNYRIGNRYQANDNDPITLGYNGVSNYVSQQSTQLTDFLSAVGYYQKHQPWTRWSNFNNGSTLSFDRLLGIKYTYGNNSKNFSKIVEDANANGMSGDNTFLTMPVASGVSKITKGHWFGTRDVNAFPLVFRANGDTVNKALQVEYSPTHNPFLVQNEVWKRLAGSQNMMINQATRMTKKINSFESVLNHSGNVYAFFPTAEKETPAAVKVKVNGKIVSDLNQSDAENGIVYLGKFERNQKITVTLDKMVKESLVTYQAPFIAVENEQSFKLARQKLVDQSIDGISLKGACLKFLTGSEFSHGTVVTTIPFDSGWKGFVDGRQEKLRRVAGEFMGIDVPSGRHKVVLKYEVPGLRLGLILSLTGILILTVFICTSSWLSHVRVENSLRED